MALNLAPLTTSHTDGDPGHTAGHNDTNTAINTIATYIDEDGTSDDYTALAAYIAALPAGATLDLRGLNYKITTPLTVGKALQVRNGTITAAAHNALRITASGVSLGPNLTVTRSTSYGVTDTLSARATVAASAPFTSDGVNIPAAAHSCFYLTHALCNGSTIRGGTLTPSVAAQDAAGVYVAAGGTGNLDITVENVTVPSGTQGIIVFDAKRCTVRGCRVSNMAVLPTVTTSGWSVVSGNVYRCRTASGSPGTTGPSTDRTEGNTRVVKRAGTVLTENSSTPTTPGASQWGISGGYLYIDLGGTDPSGVTITSDIVSGYGITFYSTVNGFTDMSENLVAHNYVTSVDGFGIYMQIANYALTCVNNKTIGNTLKSVCLKGSQDGHLPFAGLAWNGGINCRSIGDTVDTPGAFGFVAPGFFASDGSVACRGAAIGVVVTNSLTEGFKLTSATWTYDGCSADGNVVGFRAIFPNIGGVVRDIQLIGCRATGNTQQGVYLDGSTSGANASATIIGGTFHNNGQQGIQITTMRHTMVVGAALTHKRARPAFVRGRYQPVRRHRVHRQLRLPTRRHRRHRHRQVRPRTPRRAAGRHAGVHGVLQHRRQARPTPRSPPCPPPTWCRRTRPAPPSATPPRASWRSRSTTTGSAATTARSRSRCRRRPTPTASTGACSLTAAPRTDTTATNGTSYDFGTGSTAFGLQAYLQVLSFTGTSCTIKLQESSDNAGRTRSPTLSADPSARRPRSVRPASPPPPAKPSNATCGSSPPAPSQAARSWSR
jgi:hypothetical protein